jgi:hypothetical protein
MIMDMTGADLPQDDSAQEAADSLTEKQNLCSMIFGRVVVKRRISFPSGL